METTTNESIKETSGSRRNPVMRKIASVTEEDQTVTVVFPSGSDNSEQKTDTKQSI